MPVLRRPVEPAPHFGHSIAMLMRTSPRHDDTSENGPLANAEEASMTIYISQGRYTAAAIKGMSAKPEDRSEAVAELPSSAFGDDNRVRLSVAPTQASIPIRQADILA